MAETFSWTRNCTKYVSCPTHRRGHFSADVIGGAIISVKRYITAHPAVHLEAEILKFTGVFPYRSEPVTCWFTSCTSILLSLVIGLLPRRKSWLHCHVCCMEFGWTVRGMLPWQPECSLVQCREQTMDEDVAVSMFGTDKYGPAVRQGQSSRTREINWAVLCCVVTTAMLLLWWCWADVASICVCGTACPQTYSSWRPVSTERGHRLYHLGV